MKNYGYVPSALPDAKCYGDAAPKSPADITRALADAFASAQAAAAKLGAGVSQAAQLPPVSTAEHHRGCAEPAERGVRCGCVRRGRGAPPEGCELQRARLRLQQRGRAGVPTDSCGRGAP